MASIIQSLFPQNYIVLVNDTDLVLYNIAGKTIRYQRRFPIDGEDGLTLAMRQMHGSCAIKAEDTVIIALPDHYFTLIDFTLPGAAADNLNEAVHYELLRHISYDPELAWQHIYTDEADDNDGATIEVCVTLALKQPLHDILARITAAGIAPASIAPSLALQAWLFARDGIYLNSTDGNVAIVQQHDARIVFNAAGITSAADMAAQQHNLLQQVQSRVDSALPLWFSGSAPQVGDSAAVSQCNELELADGHPVPGIKHLPCKIDLIAADKLARQRYWGKIQLVLALLVILSFLMLPLVHLYARKTALTRIDQQIEQVKQRAEQLGAVRQENQRIKDEISAIATWRDAQPQAVAVLKEVTDILPRDTWLDSFSLRERHLSLRGSSAAATEVIEAMENSPLFSAVHFDSPVIKRGNRETFTIIATLNKG